MALVSEEQLTITLGEKVWAVINLIQVLQTTFSPKIEIYALHQRRNG